jgi:hypothetical protein
MNNTPAIHKLTQAILNGGKVTPSGITKRVLVSTPDSGYWYVLTMTDAPKTRVFTVRREDAKLEHNITGSDFSKWTTRLEQGAQA